MKKWIVRLMIGLIFALPFGLVTTVWVQAEAPRIEIDNPSGPDCDACHPAIYASWENSSHGVAMTDPSFREAWLAQGEKSECLVCHTTGYDMRTHTWDADGISCQACHEPIVADHPLSPMPSDRSANLCGSCHNETLFEWQASKHRETDLGCVDCHGQHATSLRAEDADALCSNCHRDRASNYAHTAHSQEGLGCADCHLGPTNGDTGEGHAVRDHSFNVRLSTCNACHGYQMHDPVDVHLDTGTEPEIDAMTAVETAGVSLDPDPVSPIYFALIAALIGMAFGLLLSPWIERWYRRISPDTATVEKNE